MTLYHTINIFFLTIQKSFVIIYILLFNLTIIQSYVSTISFANSKKLMKSDSTSSSKNPDSHISNLYLFRKKNKKQIKPGLKLIRIDINDI